MATDVGGTYRSTYKVYDDAGNLIAPSTKTFTVTAPDQSTSTPAITTIVAGSYYSDVTFTQEGLYKLQWVTTGPNTAKTDYEPAEAFRSVIGLADIRKFLGAKSTLRDDVLREFMSFATEEAERWVGTCVIRTITNDDIPGSNKPVLKLPHGPLPNKNASVTITASYTGQTWTNPQLIIHPRSGTVETLSHTEFTGGPWTATYLAGRTIIPKRVIMAVQLIVWDLWATQRGIMDDPLRPNFSDEQDFASHVPAGYEMPPQAKWWLKRESMPGFG